MEVANSEVLLFDHEEKEKNRAILAPCSISLGCLCVAVRVSSYFPSLGSCTLSYHITLWGEASLDQAHSLCDSTATPPRPPPAVVGLGQERTHCSSWTNLENSKIWSL